MPAKAAGSAARTARSSRRQSPRCAPTASMRAGRWPPRWRGGGGAADLAEAASVAADSGGLPPLREVIARHGIAARKSLGQNFILDLNLTRRIARAAGRLDDATVIEIGPGPGGLTRALLEEGAARIVAIERDPRCLAALAELAAVFPG